MRGRTPAGARCYTTDDDGVKSVIHPLKQCRGTSMKKTELRSGRLLPLTFAVVLAACSSGGSAPPPDPPIPPMPPPPSSSDPIHVNQSGYHTDNQKLAIVTDTSASIAELLDSGDNVVYSANLSSASLWSPADQSVKAFDFSAIDTPGAYRVRSDTGSVSPEFTIGDSVFEDLGRIALKAFYFTRSGTELLRQYAGQWERAAGHPDTAVAVHTSAAGPVRVEGSIISAPGGWYDAGDYNKYVVNASFATYMMLAPYDACANCFFDADTNIPESGNGQADLLDEIRFNLDWMLAMQDPADGGVYHKLTSKNFSGFVMPADDGAERFVVQKSTAAALDFAAVTAIAARVYGATDPGYTATLEIAARAAWDWAVQNPQVLYVQPADISTGTYAFSSDDFVDEWGWARIELFLLTGDASYTANWSAANQAGGVPWWGGVMTLGWMSAVRDTATPADIRDVAEARILAAADNLVAAASNGYRVGMTSGDFVWGSNGLAATQAVLLAHAYELTGNQDYLDTATSSIDYLFGRNPLGVSFVTGVGTRYPMFIHHRPSGADGIDEPVPGLLAGGPNQDQQDLGDCPVAYPSDLPALSYLDHECSYASNEIAINWNAALVAALYFVDQVN